MLERNIFNNKLFYSEHSLVNPEHSLSSIQTNYLVSLCAELSRAIYNPGYFIPPGWNLLHSYEDGGTGYRGAFYTRNLLTTNAHTELNKVYIEAQRSVLTSRPNEKLFNPNLNHFKPATKDTDKIIEEFTLVEKPAPSRCSIM